MRRRPQGRERTRPILRAPRSERPRPGSRPPSGALKRPAARAPEPFLRSRLRSRPRLWWCQERLRVQIGDAHTRKVRQALEADEPWPPLRTELRTESPEAIELEGVVEMQKR